jgi:hypothetical protein
MAYGRAGRVCSWMHPCGGGAGNIQAPGLRAARIVGSGHLCPPRVRGWQRLQHAWPSGVPRPVAIGPAPARRHGRAHCAQRAAHGQARHHRPALGRLHPGITALQHAVRVHRPQPLLRQPGQLQGPGHAVAAAARAQALGQLRPADAGAPGRSACSAWRWRARSSVEPLALLASSPRGLAHLQRQPVQPLGLLVEPAAPPPAAAPAAAPAVGPGRRPQGAASSAAAVGVGARRSAARSARVTSVSWPTPHTTGSGLPATARTTRSSLKAHRSSSEPPPRTSSSTSTSCALHWPGAAPARVRRRLGTLHQAPDRPPPAPAARAAAGVSARRAGPPRPAT